MADPRLMKFEGVVSLLSAAGLREAMLLQTANAIVEYLALSASAPARDGVVRKIVAIAESADSVSVVADDGTAWTLTDGGKTWVQYPVLPEIAGSVEPAGEG